LEIANVFLQYNTGAAATTFVVNEPERNSIRSGSVHSKSKISISLKSANEPADTASTSHVTSARSGFSPFARKPPYIPAALNPSAAVTPPGI